MEPLPRTGRSRDITLTLRGIPISAASKPLSRAAPEPRAISSKVALEPRPCAPARVPRRAGPARAQRVALAVALALAGALPAPAGAEEDAPSAEAFELAGHVELVYERRQNLDLDRAEGDDLDLLPLELELDALFRPSERFEAYVQAQLTQWLVLHEEGPNDVPATELAVEEAYVLLSEPAAGLALQLGRQSFEDPRQWLYDAELDAARAYYLAAGLALELSASREALVDQDLLNPDDTEPADNYILRGAYELGDDREVAAYGILRDHGAGDRSAFLGLSSFGTIGQHLTYWLDAAHLRGEEDGSDLRGYGIDLLGTYHLAARFAPHLILGYAFGSGDPDPDDDRDHSFRQTGLQGNETEVGGLTPFSYYGETFDPELSNLAIVTLGLGARPTPRLSADLIYHHYRQDEAADELRDAGIDAEPSGRSRDLGSELDLVLGFEELGDLRIRGFLGWFMPGRAFERSDDALFARLEIQYEF